jgi:hypothetical protein
MELMMLTSFVDELSKIGESAGSNVMAGPGPGGQNATASASSAPGLPKTSPSITSKSNVSAKPTNYSIVHNQAPTAAFGAASLSSKSVPPPPVRT